MAFKSVTINEVEDEDEDNMITTTIMMIKITIKTTIMKIAEKRNKKTQQK